MALYHLHVKVIQGSHGCCAVHSAAYRSGEKLHDVQRDEMFDYTRKGGVVHTEIIAPDNAPAWAKDREQLWNRVEACERQRNGQLAREIEIAFPKELTLDQQRELVRGYVREQFVSKGMIADIAIHEPHTKEADKRNPHAHIMLTMKRVGPEGFGTKDRTWNNKALVLEWRQAWTLYANHALELAGHDVRIDHRSFKDQGIELEPGVKIGTAARDGVQVVAQRRAEQAEIQRRNGEAIIAFPDIAINPISKERAAFTRGNVRAFLKSHTVDAAQLEAAVHAVMHSPELVQVGKDGRGYVHYTTRDMLATEKRMLNAADLMTARLGHWVNPKYRGQALTGLQRGPLSLDQRKAFDHLMSDSNLAVVQGYAGTGKSYMLGAAREAWEAQGYRVIGTALAGKAAEGLQISSGIESRTLASWELAWAEGRAQLTSRCVLVIDEAGMVGTRQLARVLERADEAGAKVVLVGDTRQLAAIEAGAPMRAIAERIGMVEMTDIRRQKGWQAQATKDFGDGLTDKALDAYKQHGRILEHATQDEALCAMIEAWDERRKVAPKETQVILAHRNVDVDELNARARAKLRAACELGDDHRIASERGPLDLAPHDRVMFLKNDRQLGVLNGTLGTVEEISGRELLVRLDDGREVAFDTKDYSDLRHGYAATVHKEQGVTVDRAYVLAGRTFDKQLVYVGMSRHRGAVELHWSRETFGTEQEMREALGREGGKVNVTDLAPKTVNQLSQLSELEDREAGLAARCYPIMATIPRRDRTAQDIALTNAMSGTTVARFHKEQEIYAAHHMDAPATTKASAPTAISPKQYLADSLAIHAGAAETWQHWRDAVPADQQLDARLGRGEGSKPCLAFRETRAWTQEAGRDLQAAIEQERKQALERQKTQEAIERGRSLFGKIPFEELHHRYQEAQALVAGRLDQVPVAWRTEEKIKQAPAFIEAVGPYIEHAKREREAELAKLHDPQRPVAPPTVQPAPSRYETISYYALCTERDRLKAVTEQKHLTKAQAFEQLPEVKQARAELAHAKEVAESWQREADRYAKEHPVRARVIDPAIADVHGRKMKLSVGQAKADAQLEAARVAVDKVESHDGLWQKAERHVAQANKVIDEAHIELGRMKPHLDRAERQHAERVDEIARGLAEERAQEQPHPKPQDRGRVRSLWDDDGPKPGRGRGDGGMHL